MKIQQRINFATAKDGFRLAWSVIGSGPPVLFPYPIHLVRSLEDPKYASALERAAATRTVVRFDKRGFGLSQGRLSEFSHPVMSSDIETVLDAAGIEQVDIMSTTLDCLWFVPFAVAHRERVNRMVLHDPMVRWDVAPALKKAFHKLRELDWYAYWEAAKAMQMDLSPEEVRRAARLCADSVTLEDWETFMDAVFASSLADLLPQCTVPTLVMKDDGRKIFIGDDPAEQVAALLPNVQILTVASAGLSQIELLTSDSVLAFLDNGWPRTSDGVAGTALSAREREVTALSSNGAAGDGSNLSERELAVLKKLVQGDSNRRIAESLVISEPTVATHVRHILEKTGTANRTEAAAWAVREGLA